MENLFLAYALIALGLLMLAAELLLPTGGILFVLAVAALVAGVAMTFYHSAANGMVTLVAIFVIVAVMGPVLVHYWPKTAIGKKFFLPTAEEDATVANMPVILELEQLRGRYGKTISALRPAGLVDFHGKRIDTMSDGDLIDPGQWVRCIDVKAGRVIVRRVDRPPDLGEVDPDDLKNVD